MAETSDCPLCSPAAEDVLWSDDRCRIIAVDDCDYPGFCRVIWHAHVKEMSDLPSRDRQHVMEVVHAVEAGLRALLLPDKINIASFGNMVPHLHWHVIPRFADDRHFPEPIWGRQQRAPARHPERIPDPAALTERIRQYLQHPS